MSGLQEAFYIMGIVFMALMFFLTLILVVSVFIIRSKIVKIHEAIDHKLENLLKVAEKGGELSSLAGSAVLHTAKKALSKTKR